VELERQLSLALEPSFAELGIKGGDYEVLSQLRRAGAPYQRTPTELSQLMYLSTGAMTRRLDRLEKDGFLERIPHHSDRRSIVVRLTPAGIDVADRAVERIVPLLAELVEPVRADVPKFEQIANTVLQHLAPQ
jgi:DNA-binding MarR family transcriptional regulator